MQGKRAVGAGSPGANAKGQVLPAPWAGVCSGVRLCPSGDHSWGVRAVLSGETGIKACRELRTLPRCAAWTQRGPE